MPQDANESKPDIFAVPWGHHKIIIDKCKGDIAKAVFYIHETVANKSDGWHWHLAPAYDLTPSDGGYNGKHATSVGGTSRPKDADFIACGRRAQLSESSCQGIIGHIRKVCKEKGIDA